MMTLMLTPKVIKHHWIMTLMHFAIVTIYHESLTNASSHRIDDSVIYTIYQSFQMNHILCGSIGDQNRSSQDDKFWQGDKCDIITSLTLMGTQSHRTNYAIYIHVI